VECFEGLENVAGTPSIDAELIILALVAALVFECVILAEGLFVKEALEMEEQVVTPDVVNEKQEINGMRK
jgi:hypothetical protein